MGIKNSKWVGNSINAVMECLSEFSVVTWNVWNNVDCDVGVRARLIGETLSRLSPDVVMLQELTAPLLSALDALSCFSLLFPHRLLPSFDRFPYGTAMFAVRPLEHCARVAHAGSLQGRDVLAALAHTKDGKCAAYLVTSHLESLGSGSLEREVQTNEVLQLLHHAHLVQQLRPHVRIFGGDMNLKSHTDGDVSKVVPKEYWIDPWLEIESNEDGFTRGKERLDRFFVANNPGKNWSIKGVSVIGKEKMFSKAMQKELTGSDHFGVLLRLNLDGGREESLPLPPPEIKFQRPQTWMKYI